MKTKVYEIKQINPHTLKMIDEASEVLRQGGLVAFPTETVYGLGADALNPKAVEKIFLAKGRPSDNPLIVHIADLEDYKQLTDRQAADINKLAEHFWPGPLTLVLPKSDKVPSITTGGLPTVAVRMPDHPIALELIRRSGCPVAAPSANISGRPSPTRAEHVVQDMEGRIEAIIKGDDCRVGIESTVLDMSGTSPVILRPGILTPEDLSRVLDTQVTMDPAVFGPLKGGHAPKAPGMKYTHYAPRAEMIIIRGSADMVQNEMNKIKEGREKTGQKVGLIFYDDNMPDEAAHDFFAQLRQLDDDKVDLILAGALNDRDPVGFAVMNRMLKSAGYKVIEV